MSNLKTLHLQHYQSVTSYSKVQINNNLVQFNLGKIYILRIKSGALETFKKYQFKKSRREKLVLLEEGIKMGGKGKVHK